MTQEEIIAWASLITDPKLTRRQAIQDLLDHSKGDHMLPFDKLICLKALKLIDDGVVHDHPPAQPQAVEREDDYVH